MTFMQKKLLNPVAIILAISTSDQENGLTGEANSRPRIANLTVSALTASLAWCASSLQANLRRCKTTIALFGTAQANEHGISG